MFNTDTVAAKFTAALAAKGLTPADVLHIRIRKEIDALTAPIVTMYTKNYSFELLTEAARVRDYWAFDMADSIPADRNLVLA